MYAEKDVVRCCECGATLPSYEASRAIDGQWVCPGECHSNHVLRIRRYEVEETDLFDWIE